MKMNCDEQPDVMEVAAQEPEFKPYAAVFTDTDGTQEIIKVVWEGEYGFGDDSHTLYNKNAVKRIANPSIALAILAGLHGNPALDAALDELGWWAIGKISQPTLSLLCGKIASLRKKGGEGK